MFNSFTIMIIINIIVAIIIQNINTSIVSIHQKTINMRLLLLKNPIQTTKEYCIKKDQNIYSIFPFNCEIKILWKNSTLGLDYHEPCDNIENYKHTIHRYWQIQHKCSINLLYKTVQIINVRIITKV